MNSIIGVGIGIAVAVGFDIDPDSDTDSECACLLNDDKNLERETGNLYMILSGPA